MLVSFLSHKCISWKHVWVISLHNKYVSQLRFHSFNRFRRRQWHPTPVLLPGKSHGWRSLVGCSPWGRWGLDMTKRHHFHFLLSCIWEGNGNPLHCFCLENPRDGGAWWAAVYGISQSWTRLKWLSSSRVYGCVGWSLFVPWLGCLGSGWVGVGEASCVRWKALTQ